MCSPICRSRHLVAGILQGSGQRVTHGLIVVHHQDLHGTSLPSKTRNPTNNAGAVGKLPRGAMAAVENDHTKGKAALRADSRWVSGTKNEISVRRFPAFTTDEPKNMGGENAAPNPMEYLIGAAAGCCSIGFELQAAQAGVKLEQFEISASGGIDMAKLFGMEDGYGGLDNLVLTIKVKADADLPTLQNFADRSAASSPVLNSLKARAKVVVEKI